MTKKEKSKWEQTLEIYRKRKAEGRLDEIEPVPDEIHENVLNGVQPIVKPD